MRLHALIGAVGLCAVAGSFALATAGTPATPASPAASSAAPKFGHLVLQLEGNVNGLAVTWITPKQTGYNPTKLQSDFAVELLDAAGGKLGTYPVDLSRFDTNPGSIGKGIRVEGCEVRDSRIAMIMNVPWFEKLASMRIRHGDKVIGTLGAVTLAKLVGLGEVR